MATKTEANGTPEVQVLIPPFRRVPLRLKIEGITPLMTDNIPPFVFENLQRKREGKPALPEPKRSREEIWRDALYVIDAAAGRFGFPKHGFRKCVCRAAQRFSGDKELTLVRLYGLVQASDGYFEIIGGPPALSEMTGRNKMRNLIPIVRPIWHEWAMEVELTFSHPFISREQVVNLVDMAGTTVGIGPARPECGMTYGQFQVTEMLG